MQLKPVIGWKRWRIRLDFFPERLYLSKKKASTGWPVGLSVVEGNQNLVNPLRAVLCLSSDLQTLKNKPALFSRLQLYWSSVPLNPIGCALGSSCQEWSVRFSKIIFLPKTLTIISLIKNCLPAPRIVFCSLWLVWGFSVILGLIHMSSSKIKSKKLVRSL